MPGRAPRRKGNSGERELARLLGGRRIPLSGSAGGAFVGDVEVPGLGRGEVKRRRDGFKELYKWLEGRDFLGLRADRKGWLIVVPVDALRDLLLAECLYYCVREDYNCITDPAYREPDERIEQALALVAELPGPDGLAAVELHALCRALHRRGRLQDLQKIPWIKIEGKEGYA